LLELEPPERYEQRSAALERVASCLEQTPRCRVLDLGAPTASNLDFYNKKRATIAVADFYRFFMDSRKTLQRASSRARLLDELLPHDTDTHFDVVLAWDLLNYLSSDEIAWIMDGLSELCGHGAIMLALIRCRGEMPPSPSVYNILDKDTLLYEASGPSARPSPGYSEPTLTRMMPGVVVESRVQLRNKMVDYLFTYR